MNKEDKFVLYFDGYSRSFFNGWHSNTSWGDDCQYANEVTSIKNIDDNYLFTTEQEALGLVKSCGDHLKFWKIIKIRDIPIKKKNPYPYNVIKFKLETGSNNEICYQCGINLLAGEPYLTHIRNEVICLHCVINNLSNIDKIYENIDPKYKEFWEKHGKQGAEEACLEFISKVEGG